MKKKNIFGVLLLLFLALLIGMRLGSRSAPDHPFFENFNEYPIVFAHQGGNLLSPGNTLFAFERAAEMGVDILEMDAHITKDGVLVIIHDKDVDRTTNGIGLVEKMTLAEIKELDAGYWWTDNEGETYPYRGQGIRIPTLEEIYKRFPDYPVNIEIKNTESSIAQPICEIIRENKMQNKTLVVSFFDERMAEFRQICPEVATAAARNEITKFVILNYIFMGGLYSPAEVAFQVPESSPGIVVGCPVFISGAPTRNVQVHVWTPNTREEIQKFIDIGVDGIMSDRPDILMELLGR